MTAGIVGLGLISGSMAKAYAEAGETVIVGGTNKVRPGAVITPFPVRDEQRKK